MKFKIGCLRAFKLQRIRDYRFHRDQLLKTNDEQKAKNMLLNMPNVLSVELGYGDTFKLRKTVTVQLERGAKYEFEGYGDYIDGMKSIARFLYLEWVEDELL